jgi:hypothetical protein
VPVRIVFRTIVRRYCRAMELRRGIASVMTALTLFGGGVSLAACADPAGRDVRTGTNMDSTNTNGNNPSGKSQGYLPDNSDREPTSNPERGNENGKSNP